MAEASSWIAIEEPLAAASYLLLDLSPAFNIGVADVGLERLRLGDTTMRGIPFRLGVDPARCLVALGAGWRTDPLALNLPAHVRSCVFAWRQQRGEDVKWDETGQHVLRLRWEYADAESIEQLIRERFEIAVPPSGKFDGTWGQLPALAVSSETPKPPPRLVGRLAMPDQPVDEPAIQYRATGFHERLVTLFLWGWTNPSPEQHLSRVVIEPCGPLTILAGVTASLEDDEPLAYGAPIPIVVTASDDTVALKGAVQLDVDRGVVTETFALPAESAADFLASSMPGYGQARNPLGTPCYGLVAAARTANVVLKSEGDVLGKVTFARVKTSDGGAAGAFRVHALELQGRNWVHTSVVDSATGRPIPCRIHFRSPEGVPYQPHGHPNHIYADLDTWNVDVGGDVRLGHATYAYVDGTCQGWLPTGQVIVDVARGFEYRPLRTLVDIRPGQRELRLQLDRWCNISDRRWYSGDTHVHFLSTQAALFEAAGEDVNVVNLLQAQWGDLFTGVEEFTGAPATSLDGQRIVFVAQENRQHLLGHLSLLGLRQHVMPWASDGPDPDINGGTLEATLSEWADRCRDQGGLVVLSHFPLPNGEAAALVATRRADAIESIDGGELSLHEYYRYLNAGYQLPLVAGTDKMSNEVPVGLYRTYVQIPDGELTYEAWANNLRRGRTFISSGQIIEMTVDGYGIGDTVSLPASGGTLSVTAEAQSIFPIASLELVMNGEVIAAAGNGSSTARLDQEIRVDRSSWVAARVSGGESSSSHHDVWHRRSIAHTSPVYIACGPGAWMRRDSGTISYMQLLVELSIAHVRQRAAASMSGAIVHHHGKPDHLMHLLRPLEEARAALLERASDR
jgi:hypothetical protein